MKLRQVAPELLIGHSICPVQPVYSRYLFEVSRRQYNAVRNKGGTAEAKPFVLCYKDERFIFLKI